jgi:hypothetical protein
MISTVSGTPPMHSRKKDVTTVAVYAVRST